MLRYAAFAAWALTAAPMVSQAQNRGRGDDGTWESERYGSWYGSGRVGSGTGSRLYRDIDATTYGEGVTRIRGVNDGGRFTVTRAQLSTRGEARIDINNPTKGTIRGVVREARGDGVVLRVTSVYGYDASGELTLTLRGDNEIGRMYGSGSSDHGNWSIRFDGNDGYGNDSGWGRGSRGDRDGRDGRDGRWDGNGRWEDDRDGRDGPGRGDNDVIDDTMRGYGSLSQDRGPTIAFERARVELDRSGRAEITLDGRETVRLYGTWSRARSGDMLVKLNRVNNTEASGEVRLDRQGREISYVDGSGRTSRGRFMVRFNTRDRK